MKALFSLALLTVFVLFIDNLGPDTATQENRIALLRKEVEPLVAPLQSSKSDVEVFASFEPIAGAVVSLNALPAAQRTITLQSTVRTGHFYDDNNLCNSYAELQSDGDLHGAGVLANFNAATQEDGSLLLTAHADTSGKAQIHWQFLGVRVKPFWGGGGICPPGGGVGGSIGAGFDKGLDFGVRIGFGMASDGQSVSYQATVVSPRRIDVTISAGLGQLGNVGLPMSFDLPAGVVASGSFPLLIAAGGNFVIPGASGPRSYAVSLKPVSFVTTKAGVASEWNSAIDFNSLSAH